MRNVGAYEARTHLPRLLDRASRGESLTITRRGRPVARPVPVDGDDRARLGQAPLAELLDTVHEGRRH